MGVYIKGIGLQKDSKGIELVFIPKDGDVIYDSESMSIGADQVIEIDIVRCGECSWYEKPSCRWHNIDNKPTDFCSYGERRNK